MEGIAEKWPDAQSMIHVAYFQEQSFFLLQEIVSLASAYTQNFVEFFEENQLLVLAIQEMIMNTDNTFSHKNKCTVIAE